jgi:hypothetical protein
MKKFLLILPLFFYFLFAAQAPVSQAQIRPTPTNIPVNSPVTSSLNQSSDAKGSIRGTVYEDTNLDFQCTGDDTGLAGVPVTFTQYGYEAATLNTGADGTYGIVALKFGWWDVTITAPTGYRVVGADMLSVNIEGGSHASETVTNVNFCVTKGTAPATPTGNNNASGPWAGQDNCGVWPNGVRPANCSGNSGQSSTGNNAQVGPWANQDNCGVWPNGVRPANCDTNSGQWYPTPSPINNSTTGGDNCGVWPNGVRPANCSGTIPPSSNTGVLLPQAGADSATGNGTGILLWLLVGGIMFVGVGVGLETRRRQTATVED